MWFDAPPAADILVGRLPRRYPNTAMMAAVAMVSASAAQIGARNRPLALAKLDHRTKEARLVRETVRDLRTPRALSLRSSSDFPVRR
jgi:hypothetical protein